MNNILNSSSVQLSDIKSMFLHDSSSKATMTVPS